MNGIWLLKFWFFIKIWNEVPAIGGFRGLTKAGVASVSVNPEIQTAKEYEDVIVDCIHLNNGEIRWARKNGLPLPKQAKQNGGRLIINRIKSSASGSYVCIPEDGSPSKEAFIKVIENKRAIKSTLVTELTTSGLKETFPVTTHNPLRITLSVAEFPFSSNAKTALSLHPSSFILCNGTCSSSSTVGSFFDCANGQIISKSLVCNQHKDCEDGSDEAKCSPMSPKITVLPNQKVDVFCGDQDKSKAGVLVLECVSVGHPVPLIKWKKYEGHVPSKCIQTSHGGRGRLECPDFQQSDQGAYSCVAENNLKSAQSQPRSVAKCSNIISCKGFKVISEEQIQHCMECFCSGKTSQCQNIKSNLTVYEFPFPETKTEVFVDNDGNIVFIPTKNKVSPDYKVRESAKEVTYCSLSEENLKDTSLLKSFGRNIIIPRFKGKSNFLPEAPDLIIQGNGLSLIYNFNKISPSRESSSGVAVRFWPGNWHFMNKKVAKREDLMKVLSNVNSIFLRCEYVQGDVLNLSKKATVFLESSAITNFTNSVSYVEKCNCPAGYDGLSCESCAEGYNKKILGNNFECEKIYVPPKKCMQGYVGANCTDCDEFKGYVKQGNQCVKFTCDPIGSITASPSTLNGKCTCRKGVTGDFCEKCKNDHFYLQKGKGCSKCWCSGITDQCSSSKLYRTVISKTPYGGYNSSDGRNFWLLPSDFSGNRLTSYGGYLNYTMKYKPGIPKENAYLTVEFLSTDDETLIYSHSSVDRSVLMEEKFWSVPITEQNWKKPDRSLVTRGEFLSVLSKIKAIYIESPYHLSSGLANLTSTRMSTATPYGDDDSELALEVEQCNCPVGYSGLSCGRCSEGYYKKRNGSITQCLKCNCTYCDPEFGCPDCPGMTYRANPEDEKIPVCKPCPCDNNALGCSKDDYNQIICRCKPGFTGMQCEKTIIDVTDHDLTLKISPRRIRNKRVGTAVLFTCSYSSNEEMMLSAQKTFGKNYPNSLLNPHINPENVTEKNNVTVESYKLILEDGLEFVECFLHDGQGKLAGHIRAVIENLITTVKPLKITNCYSTVIDVKESESKDLICEATGLPPPLITWYKATTNKTAEKVDTVDGVHSIESATIDQNGTIYTCIAENSEGDKVTCPKVLIVRKKCEIVTIIPSEVREEEGRNISLLCKTSAKSNVTWSRLHKPLPSKASVKDGYLEIINAFVADSGIYICKAQGQSNNTINNTVTVIIEEKKIPPSVVIPDDDKILYVGDNFEVKCTGYGNPAPVIKWKKVNDALGENVLVKANVIMINNATVQNTGIYVCEGVSVLGNSTAYISFEVRPKMIPPTVTISHKIIQAHDGEEVTVTCTAKGYPQPLITWYTSGINNKDFSRSPDMSKSADTAITVSEIIKFKVTQEMNGKSLICFASVTNITVQADTKLTVLQSRESKNESVEFARLGSYFLLHCGSIHDNVTWEKSGGLLGDECKVLNGLMFESVQVQHNGTYICKTQYNSVQIIHLRVVGFVPKFNQAFKSYMVLPVRFEPIDEIRLELSFTPTKENGLILQSESHLLDLYLKSRRIHLGVYSKDGGFIDIVMKEFIQLRRWNLLVLLITPQYIDITIFDEKAIAYGKKTENLEDFNINVGSGKETFFVGGTISSKRTRHPQRILSRFASFDGCISKLRINQHEVDFVKESSYSEKVHLCNKCSEKPNVCEGKGKCLDAPTQYGFICVCPDDNDSKKSTCPSACAGKGCETQLDLCRLLVPCSNKVHHKCTNKMYRLQCDCAYGYSGATCEKVVEYSFCTKDVGYVRLPNFFERHLLNVPEVIKMAFTLNDPKGMLLWQGDETNHLSISAVEDGKIKYIYQNQNSSLTVTSSNELPLQKKVHLKVRRNNNTVVLEFTLSDETNTQETYKNFTRFTTNRVFGDIYLGNVPSNLHYKYPGLNGCIHYIAFGDKSKIDLREKELERMNVFLPQNPYLEGDSDEYDSNDSNGIDSD